MQIEITEPVPAIDEMGMPLNFGWSRKQCFTYNPALIAAPRRLVGESDRYILVSPKKLIILEVMDNGYHGYVGMSVISLNDKKRSTQTYSVPLSLGSMLLPPGSEKGSVRIQRKKYLINFAAMEGGSRIVKVDIPHFGKHRSLRGELVLTPPPEAQPLVTNMAWRENKNAFRCALRAPWYTAEGVIQFGTQELIFGQGNSWGIFEWSRGVRPSQDVRFLACGCGRQGENQVGFNVGYDSADSETGTANAFFLNGKLHKLDQVTFHISPSNWINPWHFTSNDKRLEMEFFPHQERQENHGLLFHYLRRRQFCGFFSGRVILDNGEIFEFKNITGFAERRKSRY